MDDQSLTEQPMDGIEDEVTLATKAFGIQLIREKILECLLRKPKWVDPFSVEYLREDLREMISKCSINGIKDLRLVNPDWLITLTKLTGFYQQPIFRVSVNAPSLSATLDRFVKVITAEYSLNQEAVPPFSLNMGASMTSEIGPAVAKSLATVGSGLVELTVGLTPVNRDSYCNANETPKFELLHLKTLVVDLLKPTHSKRFEKSMSCFPALETILNAASNLKLLLIETKDANFIGSSRPFKLETLALPTTLTNLQLGHCVDVAGLFLKNPLIKLSSLSLAISTSKFDTELMFKILNQLRESLQNLYLQGYYMDYLLANVPIRFPLMLKLKTLTVASYRWHLHTETSPLDKFLPNLECFSLNNIPIELIQKMWSFKTKFTALKMAKISLTEDVHPKMGIMRLVPLLPEDARLVGMQMFSTVQHLEITFSRDHAEMENAAGVRWIFKNMGHLRSLKLRWVSREDYIQPEGYWDSLIIGTTITKALKFSRRTKPATDKGEEDPNWSLFPSIRDMPHLEFFGMSGYIMRKSSGNLTDLAFLRGFLMTPKLTSLSFECSFEASGKMKKRWEKIHGKGSIIENRKRSWR